MDVTVPVFNPNVSINSQIVDCGQSLTASYDGMSNPTAFLWSTGETTQTIFVEESGSFTVAVTDDCGTITESTIVVNINNDIDQIFLR